MIIFIFFGIKGKRRGRPLKLDDHPLIDGGWSPAGKPQPVRHTVKSTSRRNVSRKLNFGNESEMDKSEDPTNHIVREDYKPEAR